MWTLRVYNFYLEVNLAFNTSGAKTQGGLALLHWGQAHFDIQWPLAQTSSYLLAPLSYSTGNYRREDRNNLFADEILFVVTYIAIINSAATLHA